MASTRSLPRTRRRAPAANGVPAKQPFLALVRVGARIEIAALTTAATTFLTWTEAADRFAQTVGDELFRRVNGESDSAELVAHITEAGTAHLRDLTALPRTATDHFDARLAGDSIDS
jgi:hypothetical protein